MPHVLFVSPRLLENTNRYVRAFAEQDGVTLSIVTEDPETSIPEAVRSRVAGHYRVQNTQDAAQLIEAGRRVGKAIGAVDRMTCALEQLQLPIAEARDALGIEGMSADTARAFRDKDRMKAVLRAAGVPVARSALVSSTEELSAFIGQCGFPVIVKPQAGVGARSTQRIDGEGDLRRLAEDKRMQPTKDRPFQVEEFVRAREHTCETVTIKGTAVWRSGTRYFPSVLDVLETPWVQYCVLLPRETDDPTWTRFHPINEAALSALFGKQARTAAASALTHMEWFLREDGTALVNEVGARPPGVMIMPLMSIAHDVDMIRKWTELIAFDRFTPPERKWAAGAAFFRGQGAGSRIVHVEGIEEAVAKVGDALVEMRTPKVGTARAEGYEGEGWATVRAATTEGAKEALKALVETVQVRYG
jgi:biotin carboxylase